MTRPYASELTLALSAIRSAARIAQSLISSHDKGVTEKDDLSPVTIADYAIQALLIATFQHAFPHDSFVGEEDASDLRRTPGLLARVWDVLQTTQLDNGHGQHLCTLPSSKEQLCQMLDLAGASRPSRTGRTWIFDPIDGTKTYLRGQLYAINIALLVNGTQMLGCVGCPNMSIDATAPLKNEDTDSKGSGCILYAIRGHGAHIRPMDAPILETDRDRRLPRVSGATDIRFVTCAGIVNSALDGVHEEVAGRLGAAFPGCDLVAWVLRWATLAMGLGNTTVWVYKRRDRYAKAWDHAGAMLLFEETGGKITDCLGRDIDLAVGRTMEGNFGFVAAPEHLHGRVLRTVQEVLREQGHEEMLT